MLLTLRSTVFCLSLLCASAQLTACDSGGGSEAAGPPATYTVRGVVKSVDGEQVKVQHEAIPDFKGRDGSVSEMASMTMAFGLGDGVDGSKLSADDKISMTFEVHWDARPSLKATKIEALPADTELKLQ